MLSYTNTGLHVKYPLFLSGFNESWIFPVDFRKMIKCQILLKIRPIAANFFHAGRQTDMAKIITALRNFTNVSKNYINLLQ